MDLQFTNSVTGKRNQKGPTLAAAEITTTSLRTTRSVQVDGQQRSFHSISRKLFIAGQKSLRHHASLHHRHAAAAAAAAFFTTNTATTPTTPTTATTTPATTSATTTTSQSSLEFGAGGGGGGGFGFLLVAAASDLNGPILYTEPNRTSAIDDIRSGVIYIFIATIFLSFFLILPGIRNDKFPTFLCVTTSLLVTSIILIGLFGTTWHVGEAPQMSAAYKAFSRDRIQGELSVKIGLQSVNITLRAHKYFIMHELEGPIVLMDTTMMASNGQPMSRRTSLLASLMPLSRVAMPSSTSPPSPSSASFIMDHHNQQNNNLYNNLDLQSSQINNNQHHQKLSSAASEFILSSGTQTPSPDANETLTSELLNTSEGISVDTELESDEVFSGPNGGDSSPRLARSSNEAGRNRTEFKQRSKRDNEPLIAGNKQQQRPTKKPKYTVKRVSHVDINYNERFYWIGPQQMRRELQSALERGLPYPILTVVEYLSQDDAGFNWSRQYRLAGYYTSILLWLSASLCVLMFSLHCAAPKYGIYTMQLIGCLLLFTNLTYSMLVPRGDKELVIPFEGQSLRFAFGWSFWLVLIGGCVALLVGTSIVIIDKLFPNFIFTTVLDVDYDSHQDYYMKQRYLESKRKLAAAGDDVDLSTQDANRQGDDDDGDNNSSKRSVNQIKKLHLPPFLMKKMHMVAGKQDQPVQEMKDNQSGDRKIDTSENEFMVDRL